MHKLLWSKHIFSTDSTNALCQPWLLACLNGFIERNSWFFILLLLCRSVVLYVPNEILMKARQSWRYSLSLKVKVNQSWFINFLSCLKSHKCTLLDEIYNCVIL